jgi:hypothetical protein
LKIGRKGGGEGGLSERVREGNSKVREREKERERETESERERMKE